MNLGGLRSLPNRLRAPILCLIGLVFVSLVALVSILMSSGVLALREVLIAGMLLGGYLLFVVIIPRTLRALAARRADSITATGVTEEQLAHAEVLMVGQNSDSQVLNALVYRGLSRESAVAAVECVRKRRGWNSGLERLEKGTGTIARVASLVASFCWLVICCVAAFLVFRYALLPFVQAPFDIYRDSPDSYVMKRSRHGVVIHSRPATQADVDWHNFAFKAGYILVQVTFICFAGFGARKGYRGMRSAVADLRGSNAAQRCYTRISYVPVRKPTCPPWVVAMAGLPMCPAHPELAALDGPMR